MISLQSTKTLSNGLKIPIIGLGTWQANGQQLEDAIIAALEMGYRHIDTAAFYQNEEHVGNAIRRSGIPREDIFVTSKLWNDQHGFDAALKAYENSRNKLGLTQLDLFLIHWPVPTLRRESWKALEQLYKAGEVRAIGVSNYMIAHLEELFALCDIPPMVNQFEFHPFVHRLPLLEYCLKQNITVEAYSPMTRAAKLSDPRVGEIAAKYGKSPAQILIRWGLQHDVITLPKSINPHRIRENAAVFDFTLSPQEMDRLDQHPDHYRVTIFDPEGEDWR
jgi:diketogulonate reductase-like aldo/keto reductase